MDKSKLMEQKVNILNEAARVYYQEDKEIMSNLEYDKLYDELVALEAETGIVMANSPTVKVGYEIVSGLPKEAHPSPMLSLDKTKEVAQLESWLGDKEGLLSWKLDGLTVVLTYNDGKLSKAVTRGDGVTGEVITSNARVFKNIPLTIPVKNEVVVRGEAVISYEDFEKINAGIEDVDAKYKNPRNLCSGSVRQLNNKITAERNVRFYAFSLASGAELEFRHEEMEWLSSLGFQTVEYIKVTADSLAQGVAEFERKISNFTIPSDGLVLIYDDIEYGKSLGRTAKFPRDSIAFKWRDELKSTHLTEIIWNVSRTGLINPIAVFEPVELEGTTVSRASVHNLSIVKELGLGVADEIMVYKANMIIPQIAENLTKSGTAQPPEVCPVCGEPTTIKADNGVETLHCQNSECPAKRIKSFTHFVSRNALNIDGLSEATLEKFVDEAIVTEFVDIFRLEKHSERIISMEGFGEKSFANLIAAIEKASHTTPARFLYSLGVPNIGSANAKVICQACQNKWEKVAGLTALELTEIEGIGDIMAQGFVDFFGDKDNQAMIEDLLTEITLDESYEESRGGSLDGLTFVVTGKVEQFDNRDQVKEAVAAAGGKVASSVSAKTDYLINNDINSSSSKNKKAKELGVPIITEAEFIEMLGEEIQEAN